MKMTAEDNTARPSASRNTDPWSIWRDFVLKPDTALNASYPMPKDSEPMVIVGLNMT